MILIRTNHPCLRVGHHNAHRSPQPRAHSLLLGKHLGFQGGAGGPGKAAGQEATSGADCHTQEDGGAADDVGIRSVEGLGLPRPD
jgi:hypothetical protein